MDADERADSIGCVYLTFAATDVCGDEGGLCIEVGIVNVVGSPPLVIGSDRLRRHGKATPAAAIEALSCNSVKICFGPDLAQLNINSARSQTDALGLSIADRFAKQIHIG